jgi:hypothetical protein
MNARDNDLLEAELRRLSPAPPPAELMTRLLEAGARGSEMPASLGARQRIGAPHDPAAPNRAANLPQPSTLNPQPLWWLVLRWIAPAAAVAALIAAVLVWWPPSAGLRSQAQPPVASSQAAPKAEAIEIDQQLVALFDAVAELPGGQPVRFRCREWTDDVVVRDPARGLVIERRTPRLEVVPVRFETY